MKGQPYITTRAVQPVVAGLAAMSCDVPCLLTRAGIEPEVLANPDGRVAQDSVMRLWSEALVTTGDPDLGLHLAAAVPLSAFELHAYALLSSPSLRRAFERGCRYQRLIHEVNRLSFEATETGAVLRHEPPPGGSVPRHPAEFLAATYLRLGREITGTEFAPMRVAFAHAQPETITEHSRIFDCPIVFGAATTELHLPEAMLDTPCPRRDDGLAGMLDRYAETLLASTPESTTLAARLRSQIEHDIDAPTSASEAARSLNMSVRSLHRALVQEGTTFRAVFDHARHAKATRLLAEPSLAISEVAFLVGFSEVSSFHRAFKRWSGTTPAEFRQRAG